MSSSFSFINHDSNTVVNVATGAVVYGAFVGPDTPPPAAVVKISYQKCLYYNKGLSRVVPHIRMKFSTKVGTCFLVGGTFILPVCTLFTPKKETGLDFCRELHPCLGYH